MELLEFHINHHCPKCGFLQAPSPMEYFYGLVVDDYTGEHITNANNNYECLILTCPRCGYKSYMKTADTE